MEPGTFGTCPTTPPAKRDAMSLLLVPLPPPPNSAAILLLEGIIKCPAIGQTIGLEDVVMHGKWAIGCFVGEIEVGDAFGHKLS